MQDFLFYLPQLLLAMLPTEKLLKAYRLMCTARAMADTYESNRAICKYVHSTSRGHEAIQIATAFQLLPCDFVSPYYRDESMLLGIGFTPYQLMLQLLAKKDDLFTGGREYYAHPNYRGEDKPTIIHQSSATGMQAIPTTGIAQGLKYVEQMSAADRSKVTSINYKKGPHDELPVVVCSLGDASLTEGEVSEALQFAVLKKLPIIYLVQDNRWGISVSAGEARAMGAVEYAKGFPGLEAVRINGSDFVESYETMRNVMSYVRNKRMPVVVQAEVPLLGHHTSGVRRETYRSKEDMSLHNLHDPGPLLRKRLLEAGVAETLLTEIENETLEEVKMDFIKASSSEEPDPATVMDHVFAETAITEEKGERSPSGKEKVLMVDAALYAIRELLEDHPEAMLYGQDVGKRLGGVFREAATLADQFGENRVFNTAIQEAYIIGSTAGMSAVGLKPIVEIQFADYIYPGFNQLVTELSKSCYLSCGKFPVQSLIRVPIGAYGGGGPYHSGSIETTLLSIKGIKVVYPSNAADMKGLMKAAFYDPNPVVMLEHKGLYWSKVPGTEDAKTVEPSKDYILPLGKANMIREADMEIRKKENTLLIVTYGMGVYKAKAAAKKFEGQVAIMDLRTLFPLDEEMIFSKVKEYGRCLLLTEEQQLNSFAEALAGRISMECFTNLDAPVKVLGALAVPAIPMNMILENAVIPGNEKIVQTIEEILSF